MATDNSTIKKTGIMLIRFFIVVAAILAIIISVNRYVSWKGDIRDFSLNFILPQNIELGVSEIPDVPFSPTVTYNSGRTINIGSTQIFWYSSNRETAYITSKGRLILNGPGETTITANYGNQKATININVIKPLDSIKILLGQPAKLYLGTKDGDFIDPYCLLVYKDGSSVSIDKSKLKWISLNPTIADIDDKTGYIKAILPGKAKIQYSYDNILSFIEVTVEKLNPLSIFIGDENKTPLSVITLNTNVNTPANPFAIYAYGRFDNGCIYRINSENIDWQVKNVSLVEAGIGYLVPFNKGDTSLSISVDKVDYSIPVNISNAVPTNLIFPVQTLKATYGPRSNVNILNGGQFIKNKIRLPLKAIFANVGEAEVSHLAYWESSDTKVATVLNGILEIEGPGKATITVLYCGLRKSFVLQVDKYYDNSLFIEVLKEN